MSKIERRIRVVTLLAGLPAVATALGVSGLEGYRWLRPDAPVFKPRSSLSMADAIADDNVRGLYELLLAGQDATAPITVRHLDITGDRAVKVPPLLWAVATESDWAVSMLLLRFGVRLDPATHHRAVCLAEQLDRPDMIRLLTLAQGQDPAGSCPTRDSTTGALLSN